MAPMHPHHRAQLAAAIARFEADIRRLVRMVRSQELERLLAPDSTRARSAPGSKKATRKRGATATREQPARTRRASADARPATRRRTRKERAPQRRAEAAERVAATPAAPTGSTPPVAVDMRDGSAEAGAASLPESGTTSPPVAASTSSPPTAESSGPAGQGETRAAPASGSGGGKRVRWTRESIVEELARWMVAGTALDPSFVQRHGPPGLVSAARRIFGRFDAALNVAGLHVAKLYPDGPPADGPRGGR